MLLARKKLGETAPAAAAEAAAAAAARCGGGGGGSGGGGGGGGGRDAAGAADAARAAELRKALEAKAAAEARAAAAEASAAEMRRGGACAAEAAERALRGLREALSLPRVPLELAIRPPRTPPSSQRAIAAGMPSPPSSPLPQPPRKRLGAAGALALPIAILWALCCRIFSRRRLSRLPITGPFW